MLSRELVSYFPNAYASTKYLPDPNKVTSSNFKDNVLVSFDVKYAFLVLVHCLRPSVTRTSITISPFPPSFLIVAITVILQSNKVDESLYEWLTTTGTGGANALKIVCQFNNTPIIKRTTTTLITAYIH